MWRINQTIKHSNRREKVPMGNEEFRGEISILKFCMFSSCQNGEKWGKV
jgi:hypothetical protein